MSKDAFVRKNIVPEQTPPLSSIGIIGWLKSNLFSSWFNAILTFLSTAFLFYVLSGLVPWTFLSIWNASSLNECREIAMATWGKTHGHACWAVINDRWVQLLFGFYPSHLYWRPILALLLLVPALAPVLFTEAPRKLLYVTATYPFLLPWLMWGGSLWISISILFGFLLGYFVLKYLASNVGQLLGVIIAVVVAVFWWSFLGQPFAGLATSALPLDLESVTSRSFGGFMLALLIGVVAIGCSLPIGIILALARQSDLLIVKALSIGFIEFIRGVPLITLLFVASTLLNIFLPPGSDFDIILRVIIMVTLFASAYMAEVIRGGLASLPRGQYEGADSLGLNYWQSQRLIIMPQALKVSIPPIVSTFISVLKDTTLVSIIGLMDPLGLSQGIRANAEWQGIYWELFAFIALLFFIVCFSMSRYSMYLERKLKTDNR